MATFGFRCFDNLFRSDTMGERNGVSSAPVSESSHADMNHIYVCPDSESALEYSPRTSEYAHALISLILEMDGAER